MVSFETQAPVLVLLITKKTLECALFHNPLKAAIVTVAFLTTVFLLLNFPLIYLDKPLSFVIMMPSNVCCRSTEKSKTSKTFLIVSLNK